MTRPAKAKLLALATPCGLFERPEGVTVVDIPMACLLLEQQGVGTRTG